MQIYSSEAVNKSLIVQPLSAYLSRFFFDIIPLLSSTGCYMFRPEENQARNYPFSPQALEQVKEQLQSVVDSRVYSPQIAIDGPAASGKGMAAGKFKKELGYTELGIGIFIRSFAWVYATYFAEQSSTDSHFLKAVRGIEIERVPVSDGELVQLTSRKLFGPRKTITFNPNSSDSQYGLRSEAVNAHLSMVSRTPEVVRDVGNRLRREAKTAYKEKTPIVVEGRDNYAIFGGNISKKHRWFDAMLLIYLTASDEALQNRAASRYIKHADQALSDEEVAEVKRKLMERNLNDTQNPMGLGKLLTREEAAAHPEYTIIDSTNMSENEVFFCMMVFQLQKLGVQPELSEHIVH